MAITTGFISKPGNENLVLFYEYFHGDTGAGLGASHQTGWTSLVADLIGGKEVKCKNNLKMGITPIKTKKITYRHLQGLK
jgi:hypothetical protein